MNFISGELTQDMRSLVQEIFPASEQDAVGRCVAGYSAREGIVGCLGSLIYRIIETVKAVLCVFCCLQGYISTDYQAALKSIQTSITPPAYALVHHTPAQIQTTLTVLRTVYAERMLKALLASVAEKQQNPNGGTQEFFFRKALDKQLMDSFSFNQGAFIYLIRA